MGLSQTVVARAVDVSKGTVSQIESDKGSPSRRTLRDLAKLFNKDPKWLESGEGDEGPYSEDHPASVMMERVDGRVLELMMKIRRDRQRALIPLLEDWVRNPEAVAA
jgi:transcriptional regulator with XRE-family HTH domain